MDLKVIEFDELKRHYALREFYQHDLTEQFTSDYFYGVHSVINYINDIPNIVLDVYFDEEDE